MKIQQKIKQYCVVVYYLFYNLPPEPEQNQSIHIEVLPWSVIIVSDYVKGNSNI